MKKAKMMLTALAVLAVVGGSLAFKAKHFNQFDYFSTDASGICTVPVQLFSTTTDDVTVPVVHFSTVANPAGDCTARLISDL